MSLAQPCLPLLYVSGHKAHWPFRFTFLGSIACNGHEFVDRIAFPVFAHRNCWMTNKRPALDPLARSTAACAGFPDPQTPNVRIP